MSNFFDLLKTSINFENISINDSKIEDIVIKTNKINIFSISYFLKKPKLSSRAKIMYKIGDKYKINFVI